MIIHKITLYVDFNLWLKCLDTQLNEPTNQYSVKVSKLGKQTNRKTHYKTLGTSFNWLKNLLLGNKPLLWISILTNKTLISLPHPTILACFLHTCYFLVFYLLWHILLTEGEAQALALEETSHWILGLLQDKKVGNRTIEFNGAMFQYLEIIVCS